MLAEEWILISPSGEEVTIINLNAFCRQMVLSASALSEVAKGNRRSHKGWRCIQRDTPDFEKRTAEARAYIPQPSGPKSYMVTAPDGHTTRIHGLSAFCRLMGFNQGAMSRVANGKLKHYKGWKCCDVDEDVDE